MKRYIFKRQPVSEECPQPKISKYKHLYMLACRGQVQKKWVSSLFRIIICTWLHITQSPFLSHRQCPRPQVQLCFGLPMACYPESRCRRWQISRKIVLLSRKIWAIASGIQKPRSEEQMMLLAALYLHSIITCIMHIININAINQGTDPLTGLFYSIACAAV